MKQAFLIIVFLCISYQSYAIDCPPSSTCTIPFEVATASLILDANRELSVSATFFHRVNCDGDYEVKLVNFEGYNGNTSMNFLESFNYLHYSFSSATELVVLDYLMNRNVFGRDLRHVPLCSTNDAIKRVFIYTASCGIWTKCSYKLPDPIEKDCDQGWQGSFPHYGVLNPGPPPTTEMWVDHWKWQNCGEVCCRKVYEVCRENYIDKAGTYIKIKALTKEKYPGSECSKQGDFEGPRPFPNSSTVTLNCEDGC
jgi:hypothetical protein